MESTRSVHRASLREKESVLNQQEIRELLEEQLHCVQTLRVVQVQLLAESDRDAETKRHFRQQADAAWKRYNAIYQQLIDRYKTLAQSHETLPWFISK